MTEEHVAPSTAFGWKKTLIFSLLPVLVLLGLLETAARIAEVWVPPRQVDLGQGFDAQARLFVPSPGNPELLVTNPEREACFRKQQFLIKKPARNMRIFALGESSVNYLDYEFPLLEKRLQQQLNARFDTVQIINCGGLSYGSQRIMAVAAEVLRYEPDLVMLYCGHNEFEELEQLAIANLKALPLQRILSKSALCRFLRDRMASFQIAQLQEEHNRRLLVAQPDSKKAWGHTFSREEIAARMTAFRNNVALIIQMCKDRHIPIVIGSIPSNLIKPYLTGEPAVKYQEIQAMFAKGEYDKALPLARTILRNAGRHQSSDEENDILRNLASQYNIPLADVEAAIIAAEPHHVPGEALFNDHCHLNLQGNAILSATYEKEIVRLFR